MSDGWICLHRGWRDNPIFKGEYSRADAWVWMIESACWKKTRARIKGKAVELQRGELTFSQRFLADKWGWSKSRVDRFICDLRSEGMIETRSKNGATAGQHAGQGQSIITICNYAKYQDVVEDKRGNASAENGATAGQRRGKEEQGNKETIKPKKDNTPLPPIPDWMPVEAWNGFIEMRIDAKKRPTARAIKLLVAKLDEWRAKGHDLEAILNTSTVARWTDVYEPKGGLNGTANWKSGGVRDGRSSLARVIDEGLDFLG